MDGISSRTRLHCTLIVKYTVLEQCSQSPLYGHSFYTHTSLLRTVCLLPGESNPLHFPALKFNPLNKDTPLIRKLSMAPSWSILTRFDCCLNNEVNACRIVILIKLREKVTSKAATELLYDGKSNGFLLF